MRSISIFMFGNEPDSYRYARENIPCVFAKCKCPAQLKKKYSFVYVSEDRNLIYYNVPKCASTTIRHELFGQRTTASLLTPKRSTDQYLKFAFVRNPWDRMVSNWKMFTQRPKRLNQINLMVPKGEMSFESFINFSIEQANHHWQPQSLFIPENIDFLGKIESFDEDFNRLLALIGREPRTLRKKNTTKGDDYWTYYSPELVRLVGELYKEDIERFGYDFK